MLGLPEIERKVAATESPRRVTPVRFLRRRSDLDALVVSPFGHDPAAKPTAAPPSDQVTTMPLTTMPLWRPVIVLVTVSRARTACVPAVLRVTLKVWTPALAAVKV